VVPRGIRVIGALADLVPPQVLADPSRRLDAPRWNSFGPTETGMAPAAGMRFAVGAAAASLAQAHNSPYLWRLVHAEDRDVAPGEPGGIAVRGPTVFSGDWNADAVDAHALRGGGLHMGDRFVEQPDGRRADAHLPRRPVLV